MKLTVTLNKREIAKIEKLIKEAVAIKDKIAKERDRLREIMYEFNDITDSANDFIEEFDRALDHLSQYL